MASIAKWIDEADPPAQTGRPRTDTRKILAAIVHHLRTGAAWARLGAGHPPPGTVYGRFVRWMAMGVWDGLMRWATIRARLATGRTPFPTLCVSDTQSVKCVSVAGPRGLDPGKKVKGRKRVVLVDSGGWLLGLAVVPANVQDRDSLAHLDAWMPAWPTLRKCLLDGAYGARRCAEWCSSWGMERELAERPEGAKGFVPLPKRWCVERTFGWLSRWGGLQRDRAGRLDVSTARIQAAYAFIAMENILNPVPLR